MGAQGTAATACDCLKSGVRDDRDFPCAGIKQEKEQSFGMSVLGTRRQKFYSEGSAVVQQITQRGPVIASCLCVSGGGISTGREVMG